MPEKRDLDAFVSGAEVDEAVFALRPDYRALLIAVDGLAPAASDEDSGALLRAAEDAAGDRVGGAPGPGDPSCRRLAGGVPRLRRQAPAHPPQPRGAAASHPGRAAAGEPAHRHLQRGLGPAQGARGKAVAELARFPDHREARGHVHRWYDGYRIVVSEITASYGDGRLPD